MATPQQIRRRGRFGVILGTVFSAVVFAAVAYADDISNNIDPTIDAVAEVMPLNANGANGATQLYLEERGSDGKPGCNLTGHTTLTLSVSSDNTSVATVSPPSVTFTSCGDTPILTVTPHSAGSATISVSETSNDTGATFDLAPATFTVDVAGGANTAPSVEVLGVAGGASYSKGSVPAATCAVEDAEDGDSSFGATSSAVSGPYAADGIGEQTASCSYTDGGGLTAVDSKTYSITDASAPSIGFDVSGTLGNSGWYVSNVSLIWNVTDSDSPNSLATTGCVDQNITADQVEVTYGCSASSAGGSAGPVSVVIKRDASAPTVDCGTLPTGWQAANVTLACTASDVGPSGLANPADAAFELATAVAVDTETAAAPTGSRTIEDVAGNSTTAGSYSFQIDRKGPSVACGEPDGLWHADDVAIACTAADGGSGLADAANASFSLSTTVPAGTETSNASTGTRAIADNVGNTTTAGAIGENMVDKKRPSVAATCPSAYVLKDSAATATWSATDGGSGLVGSASGTIALDTSVVGQKLASLPAGFRKDQVGNDSAAANCSYTVVYDFKGFFQPIDNGVLNKAKAGSAIPVKFSLGGNQGLSIFASGYPGTAATTCVNTAYADSVEETVSAGGSSLSYDAAAQQYVYVWKTQSAWAGTCRTLTVKLADGVTVKQANFWFAK